MPLVSSGFHGPRLIFIDVKEKQEIRLQNRHVVVHEYPNNALRLKYIYINQYSTPPGFMVTR